MCTFYSCMRKNVELCTFYRLYQKEYWIVYLLQAVSERILNCVPSTVCMRKNIELCTFYRLYEEEYWIVYLLQAVSERILNCVPSTGCIRKNIDSLLSWEQCSIQQHPLSSLFQYLMIQSFLYRIQLL